MVAAATTSLPERAEQGRNYDYRYVWIRDQCYAGQAVAVDGPHPLLDDAVRFVAHRLFDRRTRPASRPTPSTAAPCPTNAPCSCPATPVAPTSSATTRTASSSSTRSARRCCCSPPPPDTTTSTPTPPGHHRSGQRDRGTLAAPRRRDLGARPAAVDAFAADLCRRPARDRRPRQRPRRRPHGAHWPTPSWPSTADCVHPSGRWQRAPDDPRVDAALLTPALRGALPAEDPRSTATASCAVRFGPGSTTASSTASATTTARSPTPKARSCCAGSGRRWPTTSSATWPPRCATSNATARLADRPACCARSTTYSNVNCAATSRRPSSTRCSSKPPCGWRNRPVDTPAVASRPNSPTPSRSLDDHSIAPHGSDHRGQRRYRPRGRTRVRRTRRSRRIAGAR